MLISKIGTLTKQIIRLGRITFSGKGPMGRGHYIRAPLVTISTTYSLEIVRLDYKFVCVGGGGG